MAGIEVMRRLNIAGPDRFGRGIVRVVLATLLLANVSNVWQAVAPTDKPALFIALDMDWPLSNVLMLAVGVAVLRAKRLPGWQRWVLLAVGLWLPLSITIKQTPIVLHVRLALIMLRYPVRQPAGVPEAVL